MTLQLQKEPLISKEDALTGRSKELWDKVAEKHPFGFPQVAGLIAVLSPGAIALLQLLMAVEYIQYFDDPKKKPSQSLQMKMKSESFVFFGCLWLFVSISNLSNCCACQCFKQRMTGCARVYYWFMAVPAIVVHIGTLVVLWLDCEPHKAQLEKAGLPVSVFSSIYFDNVVVRVNLFSALFGSYAFLLPMLKRMKCDWYTASQLIQSWESEANELLEDMTAAKELEKGKGTDLINDYRATLACINIDGIRKAKAGLDFKPWLQSMSLGIFTELTVLFYWLSYRLRMANFIGMSGVQTRFVVALSVVAALLIFVPLIALEWMTHPMKAILKRMRKVKLHAEIPAKTLQIYNLLLSALQNEPMKACLLRIPALGIPLNVDQRFIMKAFLLFAVKLPTVLAALQFIIEKTHDGPQ